MAVRTGDLLALAALIAACGNEPTPAFECPLGTTRVGAECVGPLGDACFDQCAADQRCSRGVCVRQDLPNLSGFWTGDLNVWYEQCGPADTALHFSEVEMSWIASQDETALTIDTGFGVATGVVSPGSATFRIASETSTGSFEFDLTFDTLPSLGENLMIGRLQGSVRSDGEDCSVMTYSTFRLARQDEPTASEPIDLDGRWNGTSTFIADCILSLGVIQARSLTTTATISVLEGSLVTAGIRMGRSFETTNGALAGRLTSDGRFKLDRGSLLGLGDRLGEAIRLEPPDEQFPTGYGIEGAVSYDGRRMFARIRGLLEVDTPELDLPCLISGGYVELTRP